MPEAEWNFHHYCNVLLDINQNMILLTKNIKEENLIFFILRCYQNQRNLES